jgi:hypothetical protein
MCPGGPNHCRVGWGVVILILRRLNVIHGFEVLDVILC